MFKSFGLKVSIWKLILLVGDVCLLFLSLMVALLLSTKVGPEPGEFFLEHKYQFLLMGFVYLIVNYAADLYEYQYDYRSLRHIAHVFCAGLIGAIANIVIFYFPLGPFVGRIILLIQASSYTLFLTFWRYVFSSLALPERLKRRLLIFGAGSSGSHILQALRNRPRCGLEAQGFVDDDPKKIGTVIEGLPVLGSSSRFNELISQYKVDLVVVAITHEKPQHIVNTLTQASWKGIEVVDMPKLYEHLTGKLPINHISDLWLLFKGLNKNKLYFPHLKRIMDLVLSVVLLVALSPFLAIIAIAIKLDSRGSVFYSQDHLGYGERSFKLIKFRTMIQNAEASGPQWSTEDDPRITRVGRLLRNFRLDELPQLINVLKGDMSMVGPKPERETFVREFREVVPTSRPGRRATDPPEKLISCGFVEKIPYYSHRLLVKPGITGWAQVMFPCVSSLEQAMEGLSGDLFYVKNIGFFLDIAILLKSVRIFLFGRKT